MANAMRTKRQDPFGDGSIAIKRVRTQDAPNLLDDDTPYTDSPGARYQDNLSDGLITPSSTRASTPSGIFPCREKNLVCEFPGCGKSYNRPVRLAEHQRSHTNERPFACGRDGCDKAFLRDSHLKAHIKSYHEDQRDWICDWQDCGQAFATGQRMRNHRRRHEEREQLRCVGFPPCEQYFRKQETLQRHIATVHLQDKPYTCEHVDETTGEACGRKFNQLNALDQHNEREHSGNRFWCTVCSPEMDDIHMEDGYDMNVQEHGVGFATYGQLQDHMKIQHPPTCTDCGYVSATQAQLRAHIDIQHGNLEDRRNHLCDYPDCGRGFTSKGNLMVHKKSAHEKQKFICGQVNLQSSKTVPAWDGRGACGHGFSTKATLERHVRTQHLHLPGLPGGKEKRRQRKERMETANTDQPISEATHMDSVASRLTGARYDQERVLGCVVVPCPHRFLRVYDLEVHLEAIHGFNSLAAMEAAVEQEARSGGQFWIGGGMDEDPNDEENLLAQRLQMALTAESYSQEG